MKRIILFACVLTIAVSISAQGMTDALLYGNTDINGTARYMSMSGAFGALGGDPSSVIDNPAGLGIYRGGEFAFTLDAKPTYTQSTWTYNNESSKFSFNLNNVSYIISLQNGKEKGYTASNFGFSFNRLKSFNRNYTIAGYSGNSMTKYIAKLTNVNPSAIRDNNVNVPYLSVLGYETYAINPKSGSDSTHYDSALDPGEKSQATYIAYEQGFIDEYNFSYACNISNVLYFGVGVGIQNISYSKNTYYKEAFDGGGSMKLANSFSTTGSGWTFKFGAIARPTSFLRLGFSVQTPTFYYLDDYMTGDMTTTSLSTSGTETYAYGTPSNDNDYRFNSPFKMQASAAVVLGKSALIDVDYQYIDYQSMKFKDKSARTNYMDDPYGFENNEIKNYAQKVNAIKVGGEYRIASTYSIRAGYAYFAPSVSENATKNILDNTARTDPEFLLDKGTTYGSFGLGYRKNAFSIDVAYLLRYNTQAFAPYNANAQLFDSNVNSAHMYGNQDPTSPSTVGTVKTFSHNIVATLAFKF